MRLRTKYIVFVSILHALAMVLSYLIFSEYPIFFIVSEVFILISIGMAWQLYLQLIRPLQTLVRGADAIRDRDFNVKFMLTGKYELDKLIGVYNDMMDHLREERVRQEEQHFFLEKLIRTSPTGIVVLDLDEKVYRVNPKALQVLGLDEGGVFGQSLSMLGGGTGDAGLVTDSLIREMVKLRSGESGVVAVNGIETYKLQKSHFIDRGFVHYFIMIEEVTAEILAAEKRAYGKVIRMMAHEVNNTIGPVNSIMGSVLQSKMRGDGRIGKDGDGAGKGGNEPGENGDGAGKGGDGDEAGKTGDLGNALRVAIQRNTNLNYFMRNFADVVRLPLPDKRVVNLCRLLEDVADLMRMRAEPEVSLDTRALAGLSWEIQADGQQLEQVFINIIKNSFEAIDGVGVITIIPEPRSGRLVIRDTGGGIAEEVSVQLFSPFFSTKQHGQGIGLTLIREILINHGFHFSLRTVRSGVTEFEIRFMG